MNLSLPSPFRPHGRFLRKRGFSLVELLVVMTLLLFIILGIMMVYDNMIKLRARTEVLLEMQQNMKLVSSTLKNNLEVAGFESFREAAIFPDGACTYGANASANPYCQNPGNRVLETDGVIALVPTGDDKHFLTPADSALPPNEVCLTPDAPCPGVTGCVNGNTMDVCSPTGFSNDAWSTPIQQQVLVCGPIPAGGNCDPNNGIRIPSAFLPTATPLEPTGFLERCGVPAGSELCCVVSKVIQGPTCAGTRAGGLVNGPCTTGFETLTFDKALAFIPASRSRCNLVLPVQVLHFQVHEIPNNYAPFDRVRYLMVRRNFEVNSNGQPNWMPIAEGVEDMKICYYFNSFTCDATGPQQPGPAGMGCQRWDWGGMPNCVHSSNIRPATIRDLERAVVQISFTNTQPISGIPYSEKIHDFGSNEKGGCEPSLSNVYEKPDDFINFLKTRNPPLNPAQWRLNTTCVQVMLRNINLNQNDIWF